MGTLTGIAFTSITPFTPITPEGEGVMELNLFASTPPQSEQDVYFALYCCFLGGRLIKTEAGVRRETKVCNTWHYFCI